MNSSTMRSVSSGELHEMCGDSRTCGWSYSQCPAGSGSGSQASRLARATRPSSRATRSASWSTSVPRGDVHQMGAGLDGGERAVAPMRWCVRGVAGADDHEWSASSSSCVEVGHQLDTGHRARRLGAAGGSHLMPNASARRAIAVPMLPRPTTRACRRSSPPSASPRPVLRRLGSPHVGQSLLERQHGGQHELRDRHRPRARVHVDARPSNASGGVPSTPVPKMCTQRTRACRPASAGDRCIASSTSPSYSGPSVSPPGTATTSVPGRAAVTSAATWSPIVERTRIRAVSPLPAVGADRCRRPIDRGAESLRRRRAAGSWR